MVEGVLTSRYPVRRFAGHAFGGEEPFQTGFEIGDETAEERVAREAAEADAQRTEKEGGITVVEEGEERKQTPTPSEQQRDDDQQPPTKQPRPGRKPRVSHRFRTLKRQAELTSTLGRSVSNSTQRSR